MKVLISGGTGLVGKHLQNVFLKNGDEVVILSRNKKKSSTKGLTYAFWEVDNNKIDVDAVCSADHIIHLAGANIGENRWTTKQKQIIIDSRVKTANLLFKTLKENKHSVKTFISASGADCYGLETTDKCYQETDSFGNDFLARVCEQWEAAANQFTKLGIRTVCLRTGVVFASHNSALQKMSLPIKLGFGSAIGSGEQIMSIIHLKDLCNMYVYILNNTELQGSYNAVAVNNTNKEVTKKIASVLNKPLFMPKVPAFMLKLIFGEMATILLKGSAVDNGKIKSTGFKFSYPTLQEILNEVF
ncbi:TIGR01777 family oxidoreductase [Wenyingzhuangia sp. IMCC45467]